MLPDLLLAYFCFENAFRTVLVPHLGRSYHFNDMKPNIIFHADTDLCTSRVTYSHTIRSQIATLPWIWPRRFGHALTIPLVLIILSSAGFNSINLSAGKNTVRAVASVAVAVPELLQAISSLSQPSQTTGDFVPVATSTATIATPILDLSQSGTVLSVLWPSAGSATALALVTWAGLGPGALGSILQTYGQRSVSPPVAQVFAYLLLDSRPVQ